MPRATENLKQIHIYVPTKLYNDVREILPERGMVTSLIRRFLRRYVSEYRSRTNFKSPSDVATDSLIEEDLDRR